MKVIKKGNEKTYEITCDVCNSDLEYTDDDVFYEIEEKEGFIRETVGHFFKPDEEYVNIVENHYKCVMCPVCNNTIKRLDVDRLLKRDFKNTKWKRVK